MERVTIKVRPRVERGHNKGGEDLLLSFTAEYEGEEPPVSAVLDVEFADGPMAGVEGERLTKNRILYTTGQYGFEWEGTAGHALRLPTEAAYRVGYELDVERSFRTRENWRFNHRPGEEPRLRWREDVYINGNAD